MLNLIPPQQKQELRLDLLTQAIIAFCIAAILIILILAMWLVVFRVFLSVNLDETERELTIWQTKAEIKEVEDMEEKIKELNKNIVFLDNLFKSQNKFSMFLSDLFQDVTAGIRFDNISLGPSGDVNVRGHALTRSALLIFKDKLEKVHYVSNFIFPTSNLVKATNIDFNLSFKLSNIREP